MNVHISIPYSQTKNLGKAYNEAMKLIPDGDAACFIDYDVQLLTPDAGKIIHTYANKYTEAVLTCYCSRLSTLSRAQLLTDGPSEDSDIRNHIAIAEDRKKHLYEVTPINIDIAGMLMVIPKSIWLKVPFIDNGHCLGVDTMYSRKIRRAKVPILRMDGLYVWHTYRLIHGIRNRKHLL